MFNEQSVGRRVISKEFGIGTVAELYLYASTPHIRVDFDDGDYWFFSLKGYFEYTDGTQNSKLDIIPLRDNKQGSPDARRIVAMLASEYRSKRKIVRNIANDNPSHRFWSGAESQAFRVYDHAKELLINGESNERI